MTGITEGGPAGRRSTTGAARVPGRRGPAPLPRRSAGAVPGPPEGARRPSGVPLPGLDPEAPDPALLGRVLRGLTDL
jgi:hypothetical protein